MAKAMRLVPRALVMPGLKAVPEVSPRVTRLVDQLASIRAQLKTLNDEKDALAARLTARFKQEAEADADGKLRGQSEDHTLVLVKAENRSIDKKKLLALGVKATLIEKATTKTPYEYVLATPKAKGGDR